MAVSHVAALTVFMLQACRELTQEEGKGGLWLWLLGWSSERPMLISMTFAGVASAKGYSHAQLWMASAWHAKQVGMAPSVTRCVPRVSTEKAVSRSVLRVKMAILATISMGSVRSAILAGSETGKFRNGEGLGFL